jgi:hypothetical protein
MKNITLLLLALFISINALSQDDKIVTLIVSGYGNTHDEAKQSAFRSAIEQAFGTFISSKTEILNDQIVADQIASVTSGNIQSFTILNESQLPDSSWGLTLKAIVSISKLSSFMEAKGVAIEFKGSMFALNIKQQILNEQGELRAVSELVGMLHEPMQNSFDFVIQSSDPLSMDETNEKWAIPLTVSVTTNKNIEFCKNYFIKTMSSISLSAEEQASYYSLNKPVYKIPVTHDGVYTIFYLRNKISMAPIITFFNQWNFYTRLFSVHTGLDEIYGSYINSENEYPFVYMEDFGNDEPFPGYKFRKPFFLDSGEQVATFSWHDIRTLQQIESMNGYEVKPRGIVSQYKYGGFVVYENNNYCLVAAICDLHSDNLESAGKSCDKLVLAGYNDWHGLISVPDNMGGRKGFLLGAGGPSSEPYWSSTQVLGYNRTWMLSGSYAYQGEKSTFDPLPFRAVRFIGVDESKKIYLDHKSDWWNSYSGHGIKNSEPEPELEPEPEPE